MNKIKITADTVYIQVTKPTPDKECTCKNLLVTNYDNEGNVYCAICGGVAGKLAKKQLEQLEVK